MDWLNGFGGQVERDVSLAELTWFGLGGSAACVVRPESEASLADVVRRADRAGVPLRVLGGGANVLVRDGGVDGVVVRLTHPAFCGTDFDADGVTAGGGVDLMKLTNATVSQGLAGLECMAGIPGTVGGAVRMNAGGRPGSISDSLERIRVMRRDGQIEALAKEQVGFGYRRSGLHDAIVLTARFRLRPEDPEALQARFRENWRRKKESQPLSDCSAGCIFKNPPGESAGGLIDRAGLKGASRGRARVSERHANFIVADEGATAQDVLDLADEVRRAVQSKFGIQLEMEIEVW